MRVPGTLAAMAMVGCAFAACSAAGPGDGDLVVTLIPVASGAPASADSIGWPYPEGSRLVWLSPPDGRGRELSRGLAAAGSPQVAPDGRRVIFAGRSAGDPVQAIYEIAIGERAPRRVFAGERNCGDPAYLAHDAIVFVCETSVDDGAPSARALFVLQAEVTGAERITWSPADTLDPTPLADGRILFAMTPVETGEAVLYTVNADGSLPEPFGDHHASGSAGHRPRQDPAGNVVAVSMAGTGVTRIPFTRPARTERVEVGDDGTILSVEPDGGALLVVAGGADGGVFRVPAAGTPERVVADTRDMIAVEAVALRSTAPPRGRPRIVADSGDTGFLVGYDAGRSDGLVGPPQGSPGPHGVRLQIRRAGRTQFLTAANAGGAADRVADAPLHGDRSFFLEVPADVPLRIATLDGDGATIATSDWFWVRPGETRACFGCHAGHAAAPVNRPVEAIQSMPTRLLETAATVVARIESGAPTEAGQ